MAYSKWIKFIYCIIMSYRLLLIETPNYTNNNYKKTKEIYNKNIKEYHKRYIKLKTKLTTQFKIKLYGFDGKLKGTYDNLNTNKIFKLIESMPMGHLRKKINLSLYEDYNKKTTIKNLGFKDKEKALYTINKIKHKDLTYQKNVINTMYNRAKYHPNQTKEMIEAMKIFKKWLNKTL